MASLLPLLEVETPAVRISFYGPTDNPNGALQGGKAGNASLNVVSASGDSISCAWRNRDGQRERWQPGAHGPRFFEATTYRVAVEALADSKPPRIRHRDPGLVANLDPLRGHSVVTGTLNFRQQLGRSTFVIETDSESLALTIEVFPTKLDYDTDYEELLAEVTDAARALALEYLRSTYRTGATRHERGGSHLEWLTLLRSEFEQLEHALAYVEQYPHRAIERAVHLDRVERIRRPSRATLRAVAHGQGSGGYVNVAFGMHARARVPAQRAVETLDTAEHRWLRQELTALQQRLGEIFGEAQSQRTGRRNASSSARGTAVLREITVLQERMARMLRGEAISAAIEPSRSDFASLTLLGRAGYRDAYRSLLILRLALSVVGEIVELSVKDLDKLYELWCFIRVVRLLAERADDPPKLQNMIRPRTVGGLRVALQQGQQSAVELRIGPMALVALYNPTYAGLTGAQRPDIVIEVHHPGWPQMFIVLDAKYRLDASDAYVRSFGGPGPPTDAVNALHRYRDAIVLASSTKRATGRPVVRGAALFPLDAPSSARFKDHKLWQALGALGIGAIPFLPDNLALVEEWLDSLLTSSAADLAEPGPPFSALEHKRAQPM
jgi:predicted component of viral defense system (DUF524 family)